jgi:serine/threonine-protein kinase
MRDIGDARADLDAIDARFDVTPQHAPPPVRMWRIGGAAAIGLIAGAIAVWMATRGAPPAEPPQILHVSVRLPPDQRIVAAGNDLVRIAISPDGKRIVYGANRQLHLRPLDAAESTPIANSEEGTAPFFSPDGQSIGFLQNNRLVRLALSGGSPTALADVAYFGGARWGGDGTIVYADTTFGIFQVNSTGGTPVQLADAEAGAVFAPEVLPASKWVLYTQSSAGNARATNLSLFGLTSSTAGQFETIAYNLETRERRVIMKNGPASYLATGHLMYGLDQDAVFVAPFDPVRAELTGSETRIPLLTQYAFVRDVSLNGTLAFVRILPDVRRRPVWVARDGSPTPLPLEPGSYRFPRLSPDGSRLALTRGDARQKATDIWVYDVDGSAIMRLTSDGQSTTPVWTSDGVRLAYSSFGKGPSRLFTKDTDGGGSPQRLSEGAVRFPYAWFDRSTKLLFAELRDGRLDVGMVDTASRSGDRALLTSQANETRPDVSPDGRWLAYTSNESSRDEIYVRPMADLESGKWQVSTEGGHSPIWVSGGRELVYRAPGRMMSVAIRPGETFRFDAPRPLFVDSYVNDTGGRSYDVSADGRFLMLSDEGSSTDEIHLIVNWFETVKRHLQTK